MNYKNLDLTRIELENDQQHRFQQAKIISIYLKQIDNVIWLKMYTLNGEDYNSFSTHSFID